MTEALSEVWIRRLAEVAVDGGTPVEGRMDSTRWNWAGELLREPEVDLQLVGLRNYYESLSKNHPGEIATPEDGILTPEDSEQASWLLGHLAKEIDRILTIVRRFNSNISSGR